MKKTIMLVSIMLMLIFLTGCTTQKKEEEAFKIVTSFYPMYTIAQNVAKDIDSVKIENMASQSVGCLHDYTLKAADLKKVENADVFIINGLGIENFTNKIVETYSNIKVIDASENIHNMKDSNAHIWLDLESYEEQVSQVTKQLMQMDPENAQKYSENEKEYKQQLEELKAEIKENTKAVKNCLSFSESLAYLEESMNLKMKIIETDHEQNGLSAETLSQAIEYVKANQIKAIIIDEQTARNNAEVVAKETGAKIYEMHSGLSGDEETNSYLTIMRQNLEVVKQMEE